ncbi:hypothetical protein GALMADRAFT_96265 [Galerina marginata CBS 339.88]|uniref:NACHT domain-containing protein n=1 Tax=Galerina marginata (strain CBS 339.88) TaxID=685588 RepID=A0A067T074_GALM3|nr:hypothetical protein GALMADRAFT_96265 [Galerina marginata CBS 339.88]
MNWTDKVKGKVKDKVNDTRELGNKVKKVILRPHSPVPPNNRQPELGAGPSLLAPKATHHPSTADSTSLIVPIPPESATQDAVRLVPTTVVEESPKSSLKAKFTRTTNSAQYDIAVLHVAFVLKKSQDLRNLILGVEKLSSDPSLNEVVEPCIQFTTKLIEALDPKMDGVDKATAAFLKTIQDAISKGLPETKIGKINDSIAQIKNIYPDISTIAEKKHSTRFSTIASGVLGVALPIFDIIKEGSSMIPVPMVQPLIGVVAGFLKAADQAFANVNSMRSLAAAAAEYIVTIAVHCPQEVDGLWSRTINTLQIKLSEIVEQAEEFSSRRKFLLFLQQDRDKGDITKIREKLEQAINIFYMEVGLNVKHDLDTITRKIDYVLLDKLERLPSHSDTNDHYFGDSRNREIEYTMGWIADATDKPFLWIHGAAGVGKSTLARELLDHFKRNEILATFASFVIGIESKPKILVRMMARELCSLHPGCQPAIARAMTDCFGENEHLIKYLTHFLVKPIASLTYGGPLVIILDALDEWAYRQEFLKVLLQVDLPPNLKIVLTSRYSKSIESMVDGLALLYELTTVSNDVCRDYFVEKFKGIKWDGHEPEQLQFDKLVELANGLLIWAATVCALVSRRSSRKLPHQILDDILRSSQSSGHTKKMNDLYRAALERLFPDDDDDDDDLSSRSNILLSMVALKEALPLKEFARLVGVLPKFVKDTCSGLRALQTRGAFDDSEVQPAIKLFHASFIDFLGHDQARSVMAANCIRFFEMVAEPDLAEPNPFPFRNAQLYMYMGKHWVGHMKEGQSEVTGEQLRLWVGWLLSRLLFLADDHDYQPNSQALQSLSDALLSPQGMSYSPEILSKDLSTTQAIVADFRQILDFWGIDYRNPDFYKNKPDCIWHWALVLNGLAIGLHHIQTLTSDPTILDAAISLLENLITAYPPDDQEHPTFLNNLGYALHSRFELSHSRNDLKCAIDLYTKSRDLHLKDSRNYAISLLNLGRAHQSCFQHFGSDPKEVEQAIAHNRKALRLFQPFDHLQPSALYALGNSLIQAHSLGREDPGCLDEAMSLFCTATQFLPQSPYDLRLQVVRLDSLIEVFRIVVQHMQCLGSASRRVHLVELDQGPHIQVDLEKGRIVFKILDPLLKMNDIPLSPLQPLSNEAGDVYLAIQVAAYFRFLRVDGVQISSAGLSKLVNLVYDDPDLITTTRSVSSNPGLNPRVSGHQVQSLSKRRGVRTKLTQRPHMFALIIGIDKYNSDKLSSLRSAVSDALAIKNYLLNDLGVDDSHIMLLLDETATRKAIIDALQVLKDDHNIQRGDAILIYYAGQGMQIPAPDRWATERKGNLIGGIVPYDFDEPTGIYAIPDRTLNRLIQGIMQIRGDNITLILDCSFSGAFGGFSHVLLAGCSAREIARESSGRGQFTGSLLDALQAVSPDQITYVQLLGRLQNITG